MAFEETCSTLNQCVHDSEIFLTEESPFEALISMECIHSTSIICSVLIRKYKLYLQLLIGAKARKIEAQNI